MASFSSFSSAHLHHTFPVQRFKCVSSSQAFPPLTRSFVIPHPQVCSRFWFSVHAQPSSLPPRQSAGRLARTYSAHDAPGERIHEGGGGKRDAVAGGGCAVAMVTG